MPKALYVLGLLPGIGCAVLFTVMLVISIFLGDGESALIFGFLIVLGVLTVYVWRRTAAPED